MLKRFLAGIAFSTMMTGAVMAGPLEDGIAASNNGDSATALLNWLPLAKEGDPNAQYYVGDLYANGWGVKQDNTVALFWLNLAASNASAPDWVKRDAARMRDLVAAQETERANKIAEAQRRVAQGAAPRLPITDCFCDGGETFVCPDGYFVEEEAWVVGDASGAPHFLFIPSPSSPKLQKDNAFYAIVVEDMPNKRLAWFHETEGWGAVYQLCNN